MSARTSGPIVIGGTKWPSITSKWITRAPASITSSTWAPSLPKSAERIDGATRRACTSSNIRSLIAANLARQAGHAALSIDAPQDWHCRSSVWLMRAIVPWSPQFGHWETSSKRLRQLTQRRRPGSWVGRSQGSPQLGQGARLSTLPAPKPGSGESLID